MAYDWEHYVSWLVINQLTNMSWNLCRHCAITALRTGSSWSQWPETHKNGGT